MALCPATNAIAGRCKHARTTSPHPSPYEIDLARAIASLFQREMSLKGKFDSNVK